MALLLVDIWLLIRSAKRFLLFLLFMMIIAGIHAFWQPEIIKKRLAGRPEKEIDVKAAGEEIRGRLFYQLAIMKGKDYLIGRGARSLTFLESARGFHEVHNLFGEVFRNYGIIGLLLFFILVVFIHVEK